MPSDPDVDPLTVTTTLVYDCAVVKQKRNYLGKMHKTLPNRNVVEKR